MFFLLSIIFFSSAIFTENTFFYSDTTYLFRPFKNFIIGEFKKFSIPQWNPFFNEGMPLLSDPVMQIFYPLNIIFLLFSFASAYKIFVIAHYIIAGFFAYLLAMEINSDRESSFFCSISYSFSGYLVFIHYNLPFLAGGTFLPLFFYGALKISKGNTAFSSSFSNCAITSIAMTLQFFGGDIEIVYLELLILAFFLPLNLSRGKNEGLISIIKNVVKKLFTVIITLAGTSSALALPLLYLYPATTRAQGINYSEIYKFTFHPLHSFEFAIPNLFGNATKSERVIMEIADKSVNSSSNEWSSYIYCGCIVFLFFIFSALCRKKKKIEIFFIFLFFFSFIASCGDNFPLYPLLLKFLPFFPSFRYPAKLIIFTVLSISVLSGTGFLKWKDSDDKNYTFKKLIISFTVYFTLYPISLLLYKITSGKWLPSNIFLTACTYPVVFLALSMIIFFFSSKNKKITFTKEKASIFLILILFSDLWISGYKNLFLIDEIFFELKPLALSKLEEINHKDEKFSYRVFRSENFQTGIDYPQLSGKTKIEKSIIFNQNSLREGAGVKYGILYSGAYSSYRLKSTAAFEDALNGEKLLMTMMNVKYFIAPEEEGIHSPYSIIYRHPFGEFTILENNEDFQRVFLVEKVHLFKEDHKALEYMKTDDFIFSQEVLLNKNIEKDIREILTPDNTPLPGRTEIISYEANKIRIKTFSEVPSYLVLCDTWFAGWNATIDGEPTKTLKADYNFRAIYLPSGSHEVIFSFSHPGFFAGITISLFSFGFLFLFAIYRQYRAQVNKGI